MQGTPVVVILMILYYVVFSQLRVSGIPAAIIGFSILIAAVLFQRLGEKIDLKNRKREIKGVRRDA